MEQNCAVSGNFPVHAVAMRPSGTFPVGISDVEYVGHGVSLTPDVELDPSKVAHLDMCCRHEVQSWPVMRGHRSKDDRLAVFRGLSGSTCANEQLAPHRLTHPRTHPPPTASTPSAYSHCDDAVRSTWSGGCSTHAIRNNRRAAAAPSNSRRRGSPHGRMRQVLGRSCALAPECQLAAEFHV